CRQWYSFLNNQSIWQCLYWRNDTKLNNEIEENWKKLYQIRSMIHELEYLEEKPSSVKKMKKYEEYTFAIRQLTVSQLLEFWKELTIIHDINEFKQRSTRLQEYHGGKGILKEYTNNVERFNVPEPSQLPSQLQTVLRTAYVYDYDSTQESNEERNPQKFECKIALYNMNEEHPAKPLELTLVKLYGYKGRALLHSTYCEKIRLKFKSGKEVISFDGLVMPSYHLSTDINEQLNLPSGFVVSLAIHLLPPSHRKNTIQYILTRQRGTHFDYW
ncbi:unnamed protein product, partial [Didymodactylos carnosus]